MSYYYNYYIGYESDDGKIYPLGPYDCFGNLREAVCRSRSFASNLHHYFYDVPEEKESEDLRKKFTFKNWHDEDVCDVKYLYIDELPSDDYIRKGYFLVDDVIQYERDPNDFDGFYEHITPTVYAALLQKEVQFGCNKPRVNEYGEEVVEHNASDYMYYAYPDYDSENYESFMIKQVAYMLEAYHSLPKGAKLVALETEG